MCKTEREAASQSVKAFCGGLRRMEDGGVRASSSLSDTLLYMSLHVGSLFQGGLYIRMSLYTLLCARLYIYNIKSTTAPRRATTHHATHDGSRR
jgi:hypothetical protein